VLQPRPCSEDYLYYNTPCPWLQVKFFKFLQLYPPPTEPDPLERLNDSLKKVLTATAVSDTVNKSNADHSVLFEAVNVILAQGPAADPRLKTQVGGWVGRVFHLFFIRGREELFTRTHVW